MALSVFDLFSIGIGPSSSHTVGPMRAARHFVQSLLARTKDAAVCERFHVKLYGSLAATGLGHATDVAVVLGLEGYEPESVVPEQIAGVINRVRNDQRLCVTPDVKVKFDLRRDLEFLSEETLPRHPNGMQFEALDTEGNVVVASIYYSIGGGFVINETGEPIDLKGESTVRVPYEFESAEQLLQICQNHSMRISDVMMMNELAWRPEVEVRGGLLRIWEVMRESVERGCHADGILPGGLQVRRRAPEIGRQLAARPPASPLDAWGMLDWVDLFALAVNEENAAGGRVVTAPTNGAAGVIPAVMHFLHQFLIPGNDDVLVRFLLTAGAIGILYKKNASISAAEVGCQGEIGVACSMAAGALAEALGGSLAQVEQAAEIGMEHHLGLTCDPIAGLVQIPCIERNAMGSVQAIHAARMALRSDGSHRVSLDRVIATMRQTGADMSSKYKETSLGGLAVNVPLC